MAIDTLEHERLQEFSLGWYGYCRREPPTDMQRVEPASLRASALKCLLFAKPQLAWDRDPSSYLDCGHGAGVLDGMGVGKTLSPVMPKYSDWPCCSDMAFPCVAKHIAETPDVVLGQPSSLFDHAAP